MRRSQHSRNTVVHECGRCILYCAWDLTKRHIRKRPSFGTDTSCCRSDAGWMPLPHIQPYFIAPMVAWLPAWWDGARRVCGSPVESPGFLTGRVGISRSAGVQNNGARSVQRIGAGDTLVTDNARFGAVCEPFLCAIAIDQRTRRFMRPCFGPNPMLDSSIVPYYVIRWIVHCETDRS